MAGAQIRKQKLGAIGGNQGLKPPLEMPLQVIGKRAEEDVAFDPIISLMRDGLRAARS